MHIVIIQSQALFALIFHLANKFDMYTKALHFLL